MLLVLLGMIVTSQVFVLFRMIVPMIDQLGGE
jgi:hypothetical protein